MIPFLATIWIATDEARHLAADVREAWRRCGGTVKDFAFYSGLSEKQAYAQLAAQQPLNLYRLAQLPSEFLERFAEVLSERFGKLLLDRRLVKLIVLVDNKKPMLRCELPEQARKEIA